MFFLTGQVGSLCNSPFPPPRAQKWLPSRHWGGWAGEEGTNTPALKIHFWRGWCRGGAAAPVVMGWVDEGTKGCVYLRSWKKGVFKNYWKSVRGWLCEAPGEGCEWWQEGKVQRSRYIGHGKCGGELELWRAQRQGQGARMRCSRERGSWWVVVKSWADLSKDRKGFQQLCSDWVSGRMEKWKFYFIINKQIISADFYECILKGRI